MKSNSEYQAFVAKITDLEKLQAEEKLYDQAANGDNGFMNIAALADEVVFQLMDKQRKVNRIAD
ncbi:MAG: hypothetical protein AAF419_04710, partial [Pseudomonadota bacterium]